MHPTTRTPRQITPSPLCTFMVEYFSLAQSTAREAHLQGKPVFRVTPLKTSRLCTFLCRDKSSNMLKPMIGFLVVASLLLSVADSRPTVRNVKTDREFQRLIKHHKEKTGLPVIVDYFSHGCGPCRQIAPHYKQLAK